LDIDLASFAWGGVSFSVAGVKSAVLAVRGAKFPNNCFASGRRQRIGTSAAVSVRTIPRLLRQKPELWMPTTHARAQQEALADRDVGSDAHPIMIGTGHFHRSPRIDSPGMPAISKDGSASVLAFDADWTPVACYV
jgi:hypothetical protein